MNSRADDRRRRFGPRSGAGLLAFGLLAAIGGSARAAEWTERRLPEGGVTIKLPAPPKRPERIRLELTGRGVPSNFWRYDDQDDGVILSVTVTEVPTELLRLQTPEKLIASAQEAALRSLEGKADDEKAATVAGHPGREMAVTFAMSCAARHQALFFNGKLYQVMVCGLLPDRVKDKMADVLASFRLDGQKAPPPPEKPVYNKVFREALEFPDGGFKILWPVKPKLAQRVKADVAGRELSARIWSHGSQEEDLWADVILFEIPVDHLRRVGEARIMEFACSESVAKAGGSVLGTSPSYLSGENAKELRLKLADRNSRMRVALIGNRLWMVAISSEQADLSQEAFTNYLNSFKLAK